MTDELIKPSDATNQPNGERCDQRTPRVHASPSESSAEAEPLPIVEFSHVAVDHTSAQNESPWTWGVLVYGTKSIAPTHPLRAGDVIALRESVGEPVRLLVHGEVVAEGVLVRENHRVGLRISKVVQSQRSGRICEELIDDAA